MTARTAARLGWWSFGLALACASAGLLLLALRGSASVPPGVESGSHQLAYVVAMVGGFGVFGALIVARHPAHPIGWLFCAVAAANALGALAYEYAVRGLFVDPGALPGAEAAAWLASWTWIAGVPLIGTVVALLFPTGRLPSARWRPVLWGSFGVLGALFAVVAFTKGEFLDFPLENPVGVLPRGAVEPVGVALLAAVAASLASLVVRYRRGEAEERQQLRWVAAAALLFIAAEVAVTALGEPLGAPELSEWARDAAVAAVIVAAGIAILRYRLYDLDLVVNRTLVYAALTAFVVAVYVGAVTGLGALLDRSGLGVSLAATGVVAALVLPLRSLLQRRVDRLMYGDRDDPYRALARLGERLESALDPDAVLPSVVEAVAEGLRLPYVAIELEEHGVRRVAASHGATRGDEATRLPLSYRGESIGWLVVAARGPGEPLSAADLRLLADLARQAGMAAHAVRLTGELRRSRERLVSAREEERRRLRRDLHDELGPTLAGVGLELESARAMIERDPEAAEALLRKLRDEVQESIGQVRRIAHDLRPPTLDQLGLAAALREQAARLVTGPPANGLRVEVEAPERLPPLHAAVEVAAYRIALEALANVSRHARASRCSVRISVNGELELEVRDDGAGMQEEAGGGVGLISMRERAEELGGSLTIVAPPGGSGTVVRARLPVEPGRPGLR